MQLDQNEIANILKKNQEKSRHIDTKQHCLKILQGIETFNENTGHRAIWELVQNARDLSTTKEDGKKSVRIRIDLTADEFSFAHDGKHFDYDSLSSLIKQVSSEEKEDSDSAGQFGTGFMTTHKFSRRFYINGSYEVQKGRYAKLDHFEIDRSANELPQMRNAMSKQLDNVDKLLNEDTTNAKSVWTEFVYKTDTDDRRHAAQQGVDDAVKLMPYVMTINERLVECTIRDLNGHNISFKKESRPDEEGLHVMRIMKNDEPIDCYYLQSPDKKNIVILPLRTATNAVNMDNIPRMFIFFPLLGTEGNNINYIYHSERFFPTEPRDNIVLPDGNLEHQTKVESNGQVLLEMTEMLFNYLSVHVRNIKNFIYLAPVGFDIPLKKDKTLEFFSKRHKEWVNVFKNLPFIEIGDEHICIEQTDRVKVLDHSIVDFLRQEKNQTYLDVVYEYASQVSILPAKEEVLDWSDIVYQWNPEEKKWFITIEDIVAHINIMNEKKTLKKFLSYLKASDQSNYFKTKSIIPNREGELRTFSQLRDGKDFKPNLYAVCKPLVSNFTGMLVDEEFASLDEFIISTRDELKGALSTYVNQQEKLDEPYKDKINDVLRFCLTFPTNTPENNDRYKAMKVICQHYTDVTFETNYVAHLGDVDKEQSMYKIVFESLVKYEFKRIQTEAQNNIDWLDEALNAKYLLNLLSSLSNTECQTYYQSKIMPDYAIFPNQNKKLCKSCELKVLDRESSHIFTDDDIKNLQQYCYEVIKIDKRDTWVDKEYESFQKYEIEKSKDIANSIDEELNNKEYVPDTTIDIIKHLDKEEDIWKYWFSNIDNKKATIFLSRIKGKKHKENVYLLLKADKDKLDKLALLANNSQMDKIIEAGMLFIAQDEYKKKDSHFIAALGSYVEKTLLEELKTQIDDQSLRLEVCDEQGGQDYKIWLGDTVVYYVEVKSRWTTSEVVEMSPLQLKASVDNKNCYSLCFVDMTWKDIDDISKREYDDVQTCIAHTKVISNIGIMNERCIKSVQQTNESTHIGGSYSLIVPQILFKSNDASTFEDLVNIIKDEVYTHLQMNKVL